MNNKKELFTVLLWPILYTVGMGLSNYIVYHHSHISYDSNEYARAMLPFLAILAAGALICFLVQKRKLSLPWEERGKLPLFLIMFIPLAAATLYYLRTSGSFTYAFIAPLVTAFFVGLAEETMFRRVLYVGLLRKFQEKELKAVLLYRKWKKRPEEAHT